MDGVNKNGCKYKRIYTVNNGSIIGYIYIYICTLKMTRVLTSFEPYGIHQACCMLFEQHPLLCAQIPAYSTQFEQSPVRLQCLLDVFLQQLLLPQAHWIPFRCSKKERKSLKISMYLLGRGAQYIRMQMTTSIIQKELNMHTQAAFFLDIPLVVAEQFYVTTLTLERNVMGNRSAFVL